MKFLIFILMTSSLALASEEKFPCRFDLIGEKTFPESVYEKEFLTRAECLKRAQELLELNKEYFSGFRMLPDGKVTPLKKEKKNHD